MQVRQIFATQLGARSSALVWWAVALIPSAAAFWAGACFVWNHFLRGPYLLDSGWYSAIIYQQGLLPDSPRAASSIREYYGIHVSPLISLASVFSYVLPIGRVPYYALFQGLIYAPLGAVTAILARTKGSRTTSVDAVKVLITSLLFAFNGQALACLGYPHYEIFLSAGVCLLVAGIATGHERLGWLGLVLAGATREDGGLHALAFTMAALACNLSRRPFPIERRVIIRMAIVSGLMSVAAFVAQKSFFQSANLFRHEYLGDPTYAHLTLATLERRIRGLPADANFIVLPFLGTVVLAAVARDARYLLGWVVELPWFLVNLFAAQEIKAQFSIYTGFPFVASIFWVGAYGQIGRTVLGKQPWLGGLAAVSALSIFGLYDSRPAPFIGIFKNASIPLDVPYADIAEFAGNLARDPNAYGPILTDPSITAWAIESLPPERNVAELQRVVSPQGYDGIAFFRRGRLGSQIQRFVEKSEFSKCGNIPRTEIFMCTRPNRALPSLFRPTPLGA
jgi:hypothetical protein